MSPSEPFKFKFDTDELADEFQVVELWHPPIALSDRDHEWLFWQREVDACGGRDLDKHRWYLTIEEGRAQVRCADCPATFTDLTDLDDLLFSTFRIPVEVTVSSHQHWEGDWDVEALVHPREGTDPPTGWRILPPIEETDEERAGSDGNLAALARLLRGWSCCGAPSLCGARCQGDELSDALARAERAVREQQAALDSKSQDVVE